MLPTTENVTHCLSMSYFYTFWPCIWDETLIHASVHDLGGVFDSDSKGDLEDAATSPNDPLVSIIIILIHYTYIQCICMCSSSLIIVKLIVSGINGKKLQVMLW